MTTTLDTPVSSGDPVRSEPVRSEPVSTEQLPTAPATASPIRTAPVPRAPTTSLPVGGPSAGTAAAVGHRIRKVRMGGTAYPDLRETAEVRDGRPAPEPEPVLPDPTAQVCRVVRAAVEVLRGERPATQLARWVTPQVYDQLLERGRLMREVLPPRPAAHPAMVRRVRLMRIGETTAEAAVILQDEGRVRAAAVRLEARRGVWRVACLEIG